MLEEPLAALSTAALKQADDIERLIEEVHTNIKAANIYAGRAPTPQHYWVNGPEKPGPAIGRSAA